MSNNYSFCSFAPTRESKKKKSKKSKGPSFVSTSDPLQKLATTTSTKSYRNAKITKNKKLERDSSVNLKEKRTIDAREYNIFHIDSIIKEQLSSYISTLPELQKDLDNTTWILLNGDSKDQVMAKQQTFSLRRRIQDLESTIEILYYIFRTADIMEEYRKTMLSETSRSFVCLDRETAERDSAKRAELITRYINIAREYVDIENYKQNPEKMRCSTCFNTDMRRSGEEETIFVCTKCGTEVQILDETPSFKDTDRVNMCSRFTYSRKGHFIDAMKHHQGKQNIDPNVVNSVVEVLLKEMKFHNLTRSTVEKNHLYMFLSETSLSSHYDDLNLLYHNITGEPCPDISSYEVELLENFDEQERALDKVTVEDVNDTRSNSLNVYYKLYKLLQRLGHSCRKEDFYILKTKTKEDEHDEKMKKAWEHIGWKWIDTF